MKVSVVICTWNRATLLDETLTGMQQLRIPEGIEWELLVVDNNSTDHTRKVIAAHSGLLPIRSLFEQRVGKSFALNRALSEVTGELILWTDDDVLVGPQWLEEYVKAAHDWPEAAFFGGTIDPNFECEPPRWIRDYFVVRGPYAVNQLGPEIRPLLPREAPLGANMAVRTKVAKQFPFNTNLGPYKREYLHAEDGELVLRMRESGCSGVWVGPAAVKHFISKSRLNRRNIWQWYRGHGRTLVIRGGVNVKKRIFGVPLYAVRAYLEARVKTWLFFFSRDRRWAEAFMSAARMRGVIEESFKRRSSVH